MTNSEEWYGKMLDNENSILKERYGNTMTLSSSCTCPLLCAGDEWTIVKLQQIRVFLKK